MTDIAVHARNLGKRYTIGERRDAYSNMRDALSTALRRPFQRGDRPRRQPGPQEFWALSNVSFDVRRGEVLGVIGKNGAGKSTLLKLISRITEPSAGRAEIHGRVGSLLEVGTGFHPELTGRENIFLNGAILGMTRREILGKFDEIASFAEIEQFLDTPVKRYSSGMFVRLAFAVAAHLEPEILIVDEVLAVGDAAFQKKCLGKMSEVAHSGRTVIFVSHNTSAVRQLTTRSLLIDRGELVADGPSTEVVNQYLSAAMQHSSSDYDVEHMPRHNLDLSQAVQLINLELAGDSDSVVPASADLDMRISVRANAPAGRFRFRVTLFWLGGREVGTVFSPQLDAPQPGRSATFQLILKNPQLAPGQYHATVAVGHGEQHWSRADFDLIEDVLHFEVTDGLGADDPHSIWRFDWGAIRFAEPEVKRID